MPLARIARWLFHCVFLCRGYRTNINRCTHCQALKPTTIRKALP